MLPIASLLGWIGIGLAAVVAGALCAFAVIRWRLVSRLRAQMGPEKVLLVTSSRLGPLGEAGGEKGPFRAGLLALLRGGLYYHSWFGPRQLFVPGPSITYIGVAEHANGRARESAAVIVRFLNAKGKEDGVVIRITAPEQWVSAIKTHLIART